MIKKFLAFWYNTMETKYMSRMAHFFSGFMICTIISHFYGLSVGLFCTICAAILKEIVDKYSGLGSPEVLAAITTTCGGILCYIVLNI